MREHEEKITEPRNGCAKEIKGIRSTGRKTKDGKLKSY